MISSSVRRPLSANSLRAITNLCETRRSFSVIEDVRENNESFRKDYGIFNKHTGKKRLSLHAMNVESIMERGDNRG